MPATAALADDFNDNSIDLGRWPGTFGATETGGRGVVACTSSYSRYESGGGGDLTGSYALVEVVAVPNVGGGHTQALLQLSFDATNRVEMFWEAPGAGTPIVTMRQVVAGVNSDTNVTYNAATHRWWRIRESGGNVLWDTAPDGLTWTNRRSAAAGIDVTDLFVALASGHWAAEPDPGSTTFDNFNITPGPARILVMPHAVHRAASW